MWFFLDILRLVEMTAFCKYLEENEKWIIHRVTLPKTTLVQFFPFYAVTTSVSDSFYLRICLFSIFYCSLKISYLMKKEKNILKSFTKSDYVNYYWKLGSHVFFSLPDYYLHKWTRTAEYRRRSYTKLKTF